MTSWIDIERIRKDLVAIRALAKRLLKLSAHEWTHWELDFLEDRPVKNVRANVFGENRPGAPGVPAIEEKHSPIRRN